VLRSGTLGTLALAATLAACTDDILTGPGGSGGDFAITVSGGVQPIYSWSVGAAFTVAVTRAADPAAVAWRVADPNNNNIRSPLTHGTVPSGAFETATRERTLARGVTYRVTITLPDGRSAFRDFTP
jgi:hypothetical protein